MLLTLPRQRQPYPAARFSIEFTDELRRPESFQGTCLLLEFIEDLCGEFFFECSHLSLNVVGSRSGLHLTVIQQARYNMYPAAAQN